VRLFGEVRLESADGPVPSRSAFARTLLALLSVRPGEIVPASTLIDELWAEELPVDPKGALQIQVTRLRKWLAATGDGAPALAHAHDGYRLEVEPEAIDLARFLGAAGRALAVGLAPEEARRRAEDALAGADGDLFGGCALALRLASERVRAEELRLQLVERRAQALLELGEANTVVADLAPIVAEHRSREGLTGLLMVALFRAGRQREALASYDDVRRHLVEEHGLEPGADLASLHLRILRQDPDLFHVAEAPRPDEPARPRPLIVERNDVLASLLPRRDGPGRIVVLRGEAGIGKSTVLGAAAHDAAAGGARVGTGHWADGGAPIAAWDEALDDLGLTRSPIGREMSAAGNGVRALLAGAALDAPVLVALDDVHLADSMSLGILRALARLGVPPGVTVAVAARTPDATPHRGWDEAFAELARLPTVDQRVLAPLSRTGVTDVVASALREVEPAEQERLAALLWAQTEGHPLHLGSMLDALAALPDEAARQAGVDGIPERLQPFLTHQLDALDPVARELVDVLAVLGPSTVDVLARLGPGVDELVAARELRAALATGIVRDVDGVLEFRHALTRSVARQAVPPALATRLHLARYRELDQTGADPFDVLRHAEGAGDLVDSAALAAARSAAARAAYGRGAHEEAADLFDAALPDLVATEQVTGTLAHGLNLAALGQRDEADAVLGALAADPGVSPAVRARAAVGHESLGLSAAGDPARRARLRAALAVVDELEPRVQLDLLRAAAFEDSLSEDDPTPGVQDRLDALAEELERDHAIGTTSRAHLRLLSARADVEAPVPSSQRLRSADAALDAATASDDPVLRLRAMEFVLSAALAAGQLERVEDLRWLLRREATKVNHPRSIWAAAIVEAALAVASGDGDTGDALATSALEHGLELGIPDAFGAYGVHLAARHLLLGTLHEVSPLIEQATQAYARIAAWPAAQAVAAVHGGDLASAAASLDEFARRRAAGPNRYFDRTALCLAARAALALGDRDVARTVVDGIPADDEAVVVVGVGAAVFGPSNLSLGIAELALGELDAARAHIDAAETLAERLGWAPWVDAARSVAASIGD
jgi:DNA-binding SARP family transcriptional activator